MIEQSLYAWLTGESDVTDLVSTRIYPNKIPQSAALPAITYHLIAGSYVRGLEGRCGSGVARFQINCWANNYDTVKDLQLAIVGTKADPKLDGYRGTIGGHEIQSLRVSDVMDHPENPKHGEDLGPFGVIIDLTIFYLE